MNFGFERRHNWNQELINHRRRTQPQILIITRRKLNRNENTIRIGLYGARRITIRG